MRIDPRIEREQVDRLRAFRAEHQTPARAEALGQVEAAARGNVNLMPPILTAVKAGATVGEISDVLRGVFGEHKETLTI
jgi:methylmalonyl-CoA mutase N-terminal domain/subunit